MARPKCLVVTGFHRGRFPSPVGRSLVLGPLEREHLASEGGDLARIPTDAELGALALPRSGDPLERGRVEADADALHRYDGRHELALEGEHARELALAQRRSVDLHEREQGLGLAGEALAAREPQQRLGQLALELDLPGVDADDLQVRDEGPELLGRALAHALGAAGYAPDAGPP